MTEIRKVSDLINRMNFNYNYPSENGTKEVLHGYANIASQADISYKDAVAIRDNIPLNPSYIDESYTNAKMPELSEKLDAIVRNKDMEKTARLNPVRTMN